jgi:pSer/pThr/pTyr-binding forkhead associated (FHA) protein
MKPVHWAVDSQPFERRVWRLSGFSNGKTVAYEFAGPSSGTSSFPFFEICRVGRDPDQCQFPIPVHEKSVGRVHAELRFFFDRGLGLRDLRSTNGTFLNGRPVGDVDHVTIEVGDEITLGAFLLKVSYPR